AGGGKVHHKANTTAHHIGGRHNELAGLSVARVHDLGQGMSPGGQLAEAATKGVDEQYHQRPPQSVMDGTRYTVPIARSGASVERCGPNPGRYHAGCREAETNSAIRDHITVDVFVFADD